MRQLFAISLVIFTASTAACVVGDTGPRDGEDPGLSVGPDASGDPGPDGGEAAVCEPPATVIPNGNHNAGLACLGCHNGNTPGAPTWTVAGTLYTDSAGTAPVANATIVVVDANDVELRLATASNGNFYTSQALAFPLRVKASKCPDEREMAGLPAVGDCNSCHAQGGAQGRIHLP